MPDISGCTNTTCPARDACFRYRMTWGLWQSVSRFAGPGCFWNMDGRREVVTFSEAEERARQVTSRDEP